MSTTAWDSGNITVWEEYIEIAFVVANSLILFITSAVGIAANLFVILAVYHQKSLQTPNNALVVNLAVIDTLRCVTDCPILLTIVMMVYKGGHVDELVCDIQVASFSFSCCIQMLTLACISAERYQAIARPFQTTQRRRRIMVLIPLTWVMAILVAVVCLIFVKDSPVHVRCKESSGEASSSYDTFGLYMLFPLWAACFTVIIGFYARIFTIVKSHNRKIFDKGTFHHSKTEKTEDKQSKEETAVVENGQGKSEQNQNLSKSVASETSDLKTERPRPPAMQVAAQTEEKALKTEQSNSCGMKAEGKPSNGDAAAAAGGVKSSTTKPQKVSGSFDTKKQSKEGVKTSSEMKETSHHVPPSAQLENPESTSVLLTEVKQANSSNREETLTVAAADQVSSLPNVPETEAANQNVAMEGAVCMMPSKAGKERASKKKESKMAKRAGYIIITFILFWLPLITTILVNFAVHGNKNTQVMKRSLLGESLVFFDQLTPTCSQRLYFLVHIYVDYIGIGFVLTSWKNYEIPVYITIIRDVEILSVSVACITSLSDPIIYAAVNPQFRTEFYRLKRKFVSICNKK